jgi:CheY-like chemotaxis protein
MTRLDKTSPILVTAIVLLTAALFVADLLTPLRITIWVMYLAPLVLCLFSRSPRLPLVVAAVTTVMTGIVFYVSVKDADRAPQAFINRLMGAFTVWVVAVILTRLISARMAQDKEEWLRGGQTRVLEAIQGELSVAEVGSRALRVLAESVGAHVGAAYTVEGGELKLQGGFALGPEAGERKTFRVGQGLIGEVAHSGKPLLIRDVPKDEAPPVEGGVIRSVPRALLIAPIKVESAIVGVVELGTLQALRPLHLELAERISEPLAVAIRTARYRARVQELLDETRRQADELQAQHEELRVSNEELEEQSRALRESQARLESQQAELEESNAQLEVQTTELERQKEELIHSRQEAERATRYKSEFLANMSHELRTPLNSTLILAKLLGENKGGNLTEEQVRFARTIYDAGNDLLSLINDVLDLSKIEAGRVEVVAEETTPEQLAEAMQRTFAPMARDKKLEFGVDLRDPPKTLFTDVGRLHQILKNLLSNALKFTSRGSVRLTIRGVEKQRVRFEVRDTGLGIPAEQQEVIFEAFRQADGSTSRSHGGTGLGLSISRDLAHLLGGEIRVESTPGEGSVFTLELPRTVDVDATVKPRAKEATRAAVGRPLPPDEVPSRPRNRPAPARAKTPDDRARRQRPDRLILVVEDDPGFSQILYDLVHELDFDCAVAHSAAEALELAGELSPSGVLLDVGLPDGSGLSVLERLKRNPDTRHIPVHMISVADHMEAALQLGAVGYALKPADREHLVSAIQKLEQKLQQSVRRVLVAEDDPILRSSTAALLDTEGVEIVTVGTGKEALQALETQSFDCMVLDLSLPDQSGYEILEQMARGEQYAFPPVIVYTARDLSPEDEQRLRRYSRSIIIKGARSPERLLDEVTLFLHQVESRLPPERQRMLQEARQRDSAFEGRRILVVEDDVRNVFALSSVLEPRGAKVEIARNGREALEKLAKSDRVDLVLMDIMMPEMDGLTATREIRRNPAHKNLPIVALTAKAMADDQAQCIAAGANDYMAKPIDVDKLLSLCRVWMPR